LADRIKIAREGKGEEINLSIQFILNCGTEVAGSCHGGYHTSTYQFIQDTGYIPFDTCLPYMACSAESTEGFCPHVDTTCSALNTCKTCDTFAGMGGACTEIDMFPNATVAEYGLIDDGDIHKIMAEIYARGPVAAVINAEPIVDYSGGVFKDKSASTDTNHIVSIVGWDRTSKKHPHWIIRNSWGQYWGEMGYVRVKMGHNILGIESEIAWATPGSWTEKNFPCSEDGKNCSPQPNYVSRSYVDPSHDVEAVQMRLQAENKAAIAEE
jgi:cathepsin X